MKKEKISNLNLCAALTKTNVRHTRLLYDYDNMTNSPDYEYISSKVIRYGS